MAIDEGTTDVHEAWVAGTATKDGESISFEGGLDIPQEALGNLIEGVAITEDGVAPPDYAMFDTDGDFLVTVHVGGQTSGATSPSWFDQADFARLPPPASGTVREITPDDAALQRVAPRRARLGRIHRFVRGTRLHHHPHHRELTCRDLPQRSPFSWPSF